MNAFLGGQVSLTRTSDGRLLISGIVSTTDQKNAITNSLGDVARNAAVRVDVITVAEAQSVEISRTPMSPRGCPCCRPHVTRDAGIARLVCNGVVRRPTERRSSSCIVAFQITRTCKGSHALAATNRRAFSTSELRMMPRRVPRWRNCQRSQKQVRQSCRLAPGTRPALPNSNVGGVADIGNRNRKMRPRRETPLWNHNHDNGRVHFASSERSDAPVVRNSSAPKWKRKQDRQSVVVEFRCIDCSQGRMNSGDP